MFGDHDWSLNASRGFVSVSWASCLSKLYKYESNAGSQWSRSGFVDETQEISCGGRRKVSELVAIGWSVFAAAQCVVVWCGVGGKSSVLWCGVMWVVTAVCCVLSCGMFEVTVMCCRVVWVVTLVCDVVWQVRVQPVQGRWRRHHNPHNCLAPDSLRHELVTRPRCAC